MTGRRCINRSGRPDLSVIAGGLATSAAPCLPAHLTVRDVMRAHQERGGWWEWVVADRGDVVLGAAYDGGWAASLVLDGLALESDGTCLAHDIGLPAEMWNLPTEREALQ